MINPKIIRRMIGSTGKINALKDSDGDKVINMLDCKPVFRKCTFTANHTNASNSSASGGGAIYDIWRCTTLIDQCVFGNNSSEFGHVLVFSQG